MGYAFKGRLCGVLCGDCEEELSEVTVRLYRSRGERNGSFAILDGAASKRDGLLAEATTDRDGGFAVQLGDGYDGEAFEVDVLVERAPGAGRAAKGAQPVQFALTTLQPTWRPNGSGSVAYWEHCLPAKQWCSVLGRLGVWSVCGHVKHAGDNAPVAGVTVKAWDADWLQDDALGSAVTDATGHFHIYYLTEDFEKTPFSPVIDVELVPGPDLYFKIETADGTLLLDETQPAGRKKGRENVGRCACIDLVVEHQVPPVQHDLPVFSHVGVYKFATQIASAAGASGKVVADGRAFFGDLRLNGVLSKTLNGNPLQYAFEVQELDGAGVPITPWTQVTPAQIAPTKIGEWEHFTGLEVETKDYVVNGVAGPDVLVPAISADGWIEVPQESDVFLPSGNFAANGNMIRLVTGAITGWAPLDLGALVAGDPSGIYAQDRHFAVRMLVREGANNATRQLAGTCHNLAIDDTLYANLHHHPSWAGYTAPSSLAVALVDIAELVAAPCTELQTTLTVKMTAAHPNLGAVSLSLGGPGGPYPLTPPGVAGSPERAGTATHTIDVAALDSCAYLLTLEVGVMLTDGDNVPGDLFDQIAFCKK